MLTISTTLTIVLLGGVLLGRRLYLNRLARARISHEPEGRSNDLWERQEIAAQEQAWRHLKRLEQAEKKNRRRGR